MPVFLHHPASSLERWTSRWWPRAQRHGELIAHFSPERAVLREPEVMGIGWQAAANQTRLFGHEPDVVSVTKTTRLGMLQLALVDTVGKGLSPGGFWRPPLH